MGGNVDILTHCRPVTLNFFRNVVFFFSTANLKISALLIQFNIDTRRSKILLFRLVFNYCHFFLFSFIFSASNLVQILRITKKRTYSRFWCLQMMLNILKYKAKYTKRISS